MGDPRTETKFVKRSTTRKRLRTAGVEEDSQKFLTEILHVKGNVQ